MSAAANMAAMLVALIPAQAGDQATLSSLTDRGTSAVATVTAREAGRLAPKRLPGWDPWTCQRRGGRDVTCTVMASTWTHGGDGCKVCAAKNQHGVEILRDFFAQPPAVQDAIRSALRGPE